MSDGKVSLDESDLIAVKPLEGEGTIRIGGNQLPLPGRLRLRQRESDRAVLAGMRAGVKSNGLRDGHSGYLVEIAAVAQRRR